MIQIDMPMPINCYDCWIRQNMGCRIANDSGWINDRRDDNCPLHAQEPRVMTLEELKSCHRETMWLQVKSNHTMKQLTRDGIAALMFIGLLHNWNGYGTVWRCWASRPSKEEMEATPWN